MNEIKELPFESLPSLDYTPSNSPAMSADIRQLGVAFLKAQASFQATGLDSYVEMNGVKKWKYAKLNKIYEAVEKALRESGVGIWHFARPCGDKSYLYTRLIHMASGQYVEDMREVQSEKPGHQARGAAETYMKKQAVLCLCAIATEEGDDDGQGEAEHIDGQQEGGISAAQHNEIIFLLNNSSNAATLKASIQKFNGVQELRELKISQFVGVKKYIEENRKLKHIENNG